MSRPIRTVEGLKTEYAKVESLEFFWLQAFLRINEFEFFARALNQRGSCFGAHAYPVHVSRAGQGAVGFYSHLKSKRFASVDEG
jgi:hypothetical protein